MVTATQEDTVQEHTLRLCQAILDQPEFAENTAKIERFLADQDAKETYVNVTERGQELHQMQHQGAQIPEADAQEFGGMRDRMMENPTISEFMGAQDALNTIHQQVSSYVAKTLELGRIPTEEDFDSGCCSSGGCGCH